MYFQKNKYKENTTNHKEHGQVYPTTAPRDARVWTCRATAMATTEERWYRQDRRREAAAEPSRPTRSQAARSRSATRMAVGWAAAPKVSQAATTKREPGGAAAPEEAAAARRCVASRCSLRGEPLLKPTQRPNDAEGSGAPSKYELRKLDSRDTSWCAAVAYLICTRRRWPFGPASQIENQPC